MTTCWQRGWYVAKEAYKKFREALHRKEKLSLSALEYRINSEHGKHTDDLISDYVSFLPLLLCRNVSQPSEPYQIESGHRGL